MEYLIPIWWPSVSKIVQKHRGTSFSHCSCHCKTVSNSVCPREQQQLRGRGLPIGQLGYFNTVAAIVFHVCGLKGPQIHHIYPLECKLYQANPVKIHVFHATECVFYRGTTLKCDWASFGLILSSNRAGFVAKTWQPCHGDLQYRMVLYWISSFSHKSARLPK